jgi:alkylation response protein AidB-like acyl-CoA dehydrogenase
MTQPNNYGFGEEAALLKEQAKKFFGDTLPVDQLHGLVADDPTPERLPESRWLPESWQQMVDLGWTMLSVPESAGGLGMPAVAVAGVVEELGRAAFPSPLLPTLMAGYVLGACDAEGPLGELIEGLSASLAITDARGSWDAGDTDVTFADGKLNGTASFVQEARKVDRFLVSANSDAGLALFWVDAGADGVTVLPDAIIDLTRDQGRVQFDGVAAEPITTNGLAALNEAFPAIWTLLAADMVGAAEWQLQTTVEYVTQRKQFDHPLGFFQAVKHPLVDVMIKIDEAKSLVYNAACAIDTEKEKAAQFAHMAKAAASDTAGFASGRSVQCHGGIGFTWECYVHLYFKRQKHSQMLFGDGAWHRARLADILIGAAA